MSRRLLIGLLILIFALGATVWSLVLIREEPLPSTASPSQTPPAPDEAADPSAAEKRSAAAIANGASAQNPQAAAVVDTPATPAVLAPNQAPVGLTETPVVAAAEAAPKPSPPAAAAVVPAEPKPIHAPVVVAPAVPTPATPPAPTPPAVVTAPAVAATTTTPALIVPADPPALVAADQPVVLAHPPASVVATEPAAGRPAQASPASPAVAPAPAPPAPAIGVVAAVTPPPPPAAPRRTAPSFDVVRVTADGSAVIAGRAEPGAIVTVLDGTREIGRVTADSRGEWVLLPTAALTAGTRELSLLARGPGDIPELRSERVVVLAVPERQQAAVSGGTLAVAVVRSGNAEPSRPLQIPAAKPAAGLPLALESVDYDGGGNSVLGGRAPPGAVLRIYIDGRAVGEVTADADGRWQLTPDASMAPGVHTLRVDQLGADGRVAQRIELPFSRAEPTADLAGIGDKIIVQPGNSLWRIARRVYGVGTQYSVIYQANRTMIRDPDMIYPGQIFALPSRN